MSLCLMRAHRGGPFFACTPVDDACPIRSVTGLQVREALPALEAVAAASPPFLDSALGGGGGGG